MYWPSPRKSHYLRLTLFSAFVTLCLWPYFSFKGFFFSVPVWALFEFYYRARARQSLICPQCGFDPYLYKYDVKLARSRMEQFWSDKKPVRKPTDKPSKD